MIPASFVSTFVDELVVGLLNAQLYGADHARVSASAEVAAKRVGQYCRDRKADALLLGVVGDQVVFEARPVLGAGLAARRLLQRITSRQTGGLEFGALTSSADVSALLGVLARRREEKSNATESNGELEAAGVSTIRFLPPYGGPVTGATGVPIASAEILSIHQNTVDLLQGLTLSVCQGRELFLGDLRGAVEGIVANLAWDAAGLFATARYEEYDAYTFGHSIRVCLLATNVARAVCADEGLVRRIGTAALLHDVGKALVPFEVLHKRGRLTLEERHEMEKHPVHGAGILLANRDTDPLVVSAAYGHHHTADGRGYPSTRGEYEQSVVTRIVKICDVFEALTAARPYKPAMSPAKAYRIMLAMTGHFDPALLRRFIRVTGIYPAGTTVRLDDGQVGRVVRQSGDLDRPVVEIVVREDGSVVETSPRPVVDLTASRGDDPTTVVAAVTDAETQPAPV